MTSMIAFLDDEVAVALADITMVRALDVGDFDPTTGALLKNIPEGKVTRIDTRHNGYVWVSTPFRDVVAGIARLHRQDEQEATNAQ